MLKFALAGLVIGGTMSAAVAMPAAKLSVGTPLPVAKTVVVVKKVVRRKPVVVVPRRKPAVVVKKTIVR